MELVVNGAELGKVGKRRSFPECFSQSECGWLESWCSLQCTYATRSSNWMHYSHVAVMNVRLARGEVQHLTVRWRSGPQETVYGVVALLETYD